MKKRLVFVASILITMLVFMQTSAVFATLSLEDVTTWYWTNGTTIRSVAVGDVDGDAQTEIVTGGHYYDGTRDVAQLCTWDGSTLALEDVTTWYWTDNTYIESVAVGDVDGDTQIEIVTGGRYHDGSREVAQLCVWDGATLTLEDVTSWHWTSSTYISSVAVGDVDGDTQVEIVTGGFYWDGFHDVAQLCTWNGAILTLENVRILNWTSSTDIISVDIWIVDGNPEIVTGGYYWDSPRYVAQLCVWKGATLVLRYSTTWYWTSSTYISSVVVGDVDGDTNMEIVTGGHYLDGTRFVAQLCTWEKTT